MTILTEVKITPENEYLFNRGLNPSTWLVSYCSFANVFLVKLRDSKSTPCKSVSDLDV